MRQLMPWATKSSKPAAKAGKSARAQKRSRRAQSLTIRRFRRVLPIALLSLSLAAGFTFAWHFKIADKVTHTAHNIIRQAVHLSGLEIADILVIGRHRTERDGLVAKIDTPRGSATLAVDLVALKARVESLPWVKSAAIQRQLPSTLFISLQERQPMALWQRNGKKQLIDMDGDVIAIENLDAFKHLPIVIGEDAPARAHDALAMLAGAPILRPRVRALTRIGKRRWNVRLDNGVDVQLPEQQPQKAWKHLAELEQTHGILARNVTVIDMRLPDQLVMRLSPSAFKQFSAPGKDT